MSTTVERTHEIRKLTTLLHVSQALSATLNLKAALQEVLDTLAREHNAVRALVTLVDKDTQQLQVEAAHGVSRPSHQIRYDLGEGVIGRVAETGKPIVVPRVSREPMMVHRAVGRQDAGPQEHSFICVPIAVERQTVGALGIMLKYKPDRNYERSTKFYGVVGSMIGQAIKVQRLIAAERERLVAENAHLRQELRERYDFSSIVGNSGPMRHVY
ncbi:MAG TPA: GAF domain-containing protein, partial [Vicinamibacterales bacterium]|nr:GAF domain-containing protein [Vicinamibacterales bacterium]